jgi:DNA uptake protein ComE-like DNA-binding protein
VFTATRITPHYYHKDIFNDDMILLAQELSTKNQKQHFANNRYQTLEKNQTTDRNIFQTSEKNQTTDRNIFQTSEKNQHIEKKKFTVKTNIADTLDLQEIRGVGSVLSNRIIKYRDQLGGFVSKDQLREVWGIDSARFDLIEDAFIIDKNNITKININEATIDQLKKHPYLDYYQAKAIVREREKNGSYSAVNDIRKIELIDDETFVKIFPYLDIH